MKRILFRVGKIIFYIILWIAMGWGIANRIFGDYQWAVTMRKREPSGKDQLLDAVILLMPVVLGGFGVINGCYCL